MQHSMDRRSFVAGAAALAAGGLVAGAATAAGADERTWDHEADVVVVGSGLAGLTAAITAADEGARVILIEKAPEIDMGGNSRVCAQAVWAPANIEAGINYFKEITTDYHLQDLSDAVVEAFISEASKNTAWFQEACGMDVIAAGDLVEYPLAPSAEEASKNALCVSVEGLGKEHIWRGVYDAARARPIEFLFSTRMSDLVYDAAGEVVGIEAEVEDATISISANRAVVLCPGGFEFDKTMQSNYLAFPSLAWGTPYNTGDVHKICMTYDIDFWHMNSATPATRIGLRMPSDDPMLANMSLDFELASDTGYLWVDKYGKRFMNEARAYQHGYGRNALFYNDSWLMEWSRIPMWQILDETALSELSGRARSGWYEIVKGVTVSDGLEAEIAAGVAFKAETPEGLAEQIGVDPAEFAAMFNAYNEAAASGADDEFGRAADARRPLEGMLYIAQVWPVMVNTNGGPRRNEKGQILKTDGTPVPRLYSAGEFGSVWSWYYQGAGNIGECAAFGRIAGRNAAAEPARV